MVFHYENVLGGTVVSVTSVVDDDIDDGIDDDVDADADVHSVYE